MNLTGGEFPQQEFVDDDFMLLRYDEDEEDAPFERILVFEREDDQYRDLVYGTVLNKNKERLYKLMMLCLEIKTMIDPNLQGKVALYQDIERLSEVDYAECEREEAQKELESHQKHALKTEEGNPLYKLKALLAQKRVEQETQRE